MWKDLNSIDITTITTCVRMLSNRFTWYVCVEFVYVDIDYEIMKCA